MSKIRSRQQNSQPQSNLYISTLKKADTSAITPVPPILQNSVSKAESVKPVKLEKDPTELKKARDDKKEEKEKSVTPKKSTGGKDADDKKSGHKDRKKKDEKK